MLRADGQLIVAAATDSWESFDSRNAGMTSGPVLVQGLLKVTSADLSDSKPGTVFSADDAVAKAEGSLASWNHPSSSAWPEVMVLTARQVGLAELEELEGTVNEFRRWGHEYGGGIRRKAVVGQLSEISGFLREPHPDPLRRRLFGLAARLALIAGHMSADNSQAGAGTSYRYLALAMDAARESGDHRIAARVLNATARQLVTARRPSDAVALTEEALRTLRPTEPDETALLLSGQAWALAHLGRSSAVTRRLEHVSGIMTEHAENDRLFGPAEMAGISGACFEVLAAQGQGAKARSYAAQAAESIAVAVSTRQRFYVRSRVLDLIGLANVRLLQGEPGESVRTAGLALECTRGLRSARVNRQFHRLAVRGLEKFPQNAEVEGLAEQVRASLGVAY